MRIVYGIKNCNSVKKTLTALDQQAIKYQFFDFKKQTVTKELLEDWIAQVGWEKLLNKNSATWRSLDDDTKAGLNNAVDAIKIMLANTSIIKRPVIVHQNKVEAVGYNPDALANLKD